MSKIKKLGNNDFLAQMFEAEEKGLLSLQTIESLEDGNYEATISNISWNESKKGTMYVRIEMVVVVDGEEYNFTKCLFISSENQQKQTYINLRNLGLTKETPLSTLRGTTFTFDLNTNDSGFQDLTVM